MTINASQITSVLDTANSVTLRERGLAYSSTHLAPGTRLPREGAAYWQDAFDSDWQVRITYTTIGEGPFAIEILASANDTGPAGEAVCRVGIPANNSGEVRALVPRAVLRGINPGGPLHLAAKLIIDGLDSNLDAGVSLKRTTP